MNTWVALPVVCLAVWAGPAFAQMHEHNHGPAPDQTTQAPTQHQHDHTPAAPPSQQHEHEGHGAGAAASVQRGVLGSPTMMMESSGTSWQPAATPHAMHGFQHGDWAMMSHLVLNGVYAWSDGPRGDEKAFVSAMAMGAARRDFTNGTLNLRVGLSPDPFMGANGYPLLLAKGETADGVEPLVDRQHPHDLFMEFSASYAHRLSPTDAVFVYAGLPGEPAFGPPAFMHRMAAMDSPEAPITHHWFDSTHITFGVLTAGYVHNNWKIEASRFRGREPDQDRYDIETGALDSNAARVSWNPSENWALQASWADVTSPEALHPDEDETRWSLSALYTRALGDAGSVSATFAFSNKERSDGVSLDAWLVEAAWRPNERWTIFGRGEALESDELGPHDGPVEDVVRLSVGAVRDFRVNDHAVIGVGALAQQHFVSDALSPSYGGDQNGAMAFVRLKIG